MDFWSLDDAVPLLLGSLGPRTHFDERLLVALATNRETLELTLPPSLLALEPGDALVLPAEAEGPFEITEIRDGTARRVMARSLAPVLELLGQVAPAEAPTQS